jgi:hypothetical protein
MLAEESLPPAFTSTLSLTPPHSVPRLGHSVLFGPCKTRRRSPAVSVCIDRADAFSTRCTCLELTTQARHRARSTRPSTETDCPARTDADRSAQTASTTESPRPDVPRIAFELGAFARPRPFAWSGERRVDEAIRCRQLQPITIRRTSCRRLFERRGCGLSADFVGP